MILIMFFLNNAICQKGGTAVLINRKIPFRLLSEEKSGDSRIISIKIKIYDQMLHLLNVYAHSGRQFNEQRENLFRHELLYYLRNSLECTFIGGIVIVSYQQETQHPIILKLPKLY